MLANQARKRYISQFVVSILWDVKVRSLSFSTMFMRFSYNKSHNSLFQYDWVGVQIPDMYYKIERKVGLMSRGLSSKGTWAGSVC